jgi:hypothetical protein
MMRTTSSFGSLQGGPRRRRGHATRGQELVEFTILITFFLILFFCVIQVCLTAIDNRQPDSLVTTIDLVSSKKQAAGVILAITLGKAGLLKPEYPAETPAEKAAEKPAAPSQSKVSSPKVKLLASP